MQPTLQEVIDSDELKEIGRAAVEKSLIEWRNDRLSTPFRGNGLVIKEKDGKESNVIRFGMEIALNIALKAILEETNKGGDNVGA